MAAHMTRGTHSNRSDAMRSGRRRAVRRPIVDIAPWLAPLAWMTVLALTVGALGAGAMLRDMLPSTTPATIAVRVAPADTLWSIAEANRPSGASTAQIVEAIARINDLKGTAIRAGAVLYVPAPGVEKATFAQADGATITR